MNSSSVFSFLFFLHLPCFVFNLFPTFPLTRPHSIDSQTATDKTAAYFRAPRTFSHLLITISLLVYTSHIFYVSTFASFGSPSSALSLCTQPSPQPGLQLDFASQPLHKTSHKLCDYECKIIFSNYFQGCAIFDPPPRADITWRELSELCQSIAVKSWIISEL